MKDRKEETGKYKTNRSIMFLVYIMLAVFVALIGYLIYFQIFQSDEVINNSYNKRQTVLAEQNVRGSVYANDGTTVLAATQTDSEGNEERSYPYGSLFAHVIGYIDNGGSGLESDAAYYMLESDQNIFTRIANDFSGRKNQGNSIVTTLDIGLQQAAYNALGSQRGAVIITEPSTGRILAMVSKPDYDSNTLDEDWASISTDNDTAALLNRATQGLYPPGSTFKIVTLLEYLREHPEDYEDYSYECTGSIEVEESEIECLDHHVHGLQDLFLSFANSCNTSFVNIGLSLDISSYRNTAEELLFNKELPLSMAYKESQFLLDSDSTEWEIAQSSFGQGETLITPMHLALIGQAIANDGKLMKPYLIDKIVNDSGAVIRSFKPDEYGELMTEEEAGILRDAMENMVDVSLDWLYGGSSYDVAAKTGTAQYDNSDNYHSLFVSFSPVENPEIAVAVVLEGPTRTEAASECAKAIYDYYYSRSE